MTPGQRGAARDGRERVGITLIAPTRQRDVAGSGAPSPPGFTFRPCDRADIDALGTLYFSAYDPGVACDSREAAVADIAASLGGRYGPLWLAASPVVINAGIIVGALLTVRRAAWEPVPPCPFIIEVFTARTHRRRGLARAMLARCLTESRAAGEPAVALSVEPANTAAWSLYDSLGFVPWTGPCDSGER